MTSLARPLRIIVALALIAVVACGGSPPAGPRLDDQSRVFFVAPGGDDGGAGTVMRHGGTLHTPSASCGRVTRSICAVATTTTCLN